MTLDGFKAVVLDLYQALTQRRFRAYGEVFAAGLRRDIRSAFDTATDPATGQKWPALVSRVGDPLVLSGTLRAEATKAVDEARPTPTGLKLDLVEPPYGVFHQLGTKRIPRRRFFAPSPETAKDARRAFAADVVRLLVSGKESGP